MPPKGGCSEHEHVVQLRQTRRVQVHPSLLSWVLHERPDTPSMGECSLSAVVPLLLQGMGAKRVGHEQLRQSCQLRSVQAISKNLPRGLHHACMPVCRCMPMDNRPAWHEQGLKSGQIRRLQAMPQALAEAVHEPAVPARSMCLQRTLLADLLLLLWVYMGGGCSVHGLVV